MLAALTPFTHRAGRCTAKLPFLPRVGVSLQSSSTRYIRNAPVLGSTIGHPVVLGGIQEAASVGDVELAWLGMRRMLHLATVVPNAFKGFTC